MTEMCSITCQLLQTTSGNLASSESKYETATSAMTYENADSFAVCFHSRCHVKTYCIVITLFDLVSAKLHF